MFLLRSRSACIARRVWDLRAFLVLGFVLMAPPAHAQATYRFDLPEQLLADSLRAIAAKTGTNILFDSKDVKGVKAAALHATLTRNDAIKRLLAGTRLEAESTTPTTIIVQPIRTRISTYR